MTVQPDHAEFKLRDEEFISARIYYIEAFVRLEASITTTIAHHHPDFELRSHFAMKLKALAELKTPQVTKNAVARFAKVKGEVANLVKIRNDMVHGVMSMVVHDGIAKAAFQNVADLAIGLPHFTIISAEEMRANRTRLLRIANELKQFATPPSQPQPLPGATTGP